MTKGEIKNIIELFISWNGEDSPVDIANLDSAIEYINECVKPSLPSNLDEAANKYVSTLCDRADEGLRIDTSLESAFKACAEWMAEQGVSYQATISADKTIPVLPMKDVSDMGLDYGDKVIVQIRKRD